MKRFFPLMLCVLALAALACPALASDLAPDEAASAPPISVEASEGDKEITVNVTVVNEAASPAPEANPAPSESVEALPSAEIPFNAGAVLRDVDNAPPSDRSPLMEAVSALLGEYRPRTYTVSTYLPDGSMVQSVEPIPGLAGLDFPWLAGLILFGLSLYCVLRMIGGMLTWTV